MAQNGSEGTARYSGSDDIEPDARPASASQSGDTDDSEFGSAGEEEDDVRDERFDDEFHDALASKLHLLHTAAVEELSVRHTEEKEQIAETLGKDIGVREQQLVASQAALQAMENKMHARIVAAANRRWMQQAAAKSLASWQAWSRHRLDVRHIGGKAIARFKSRCVAEAFVRWVELCRTIGRVRRMTVRILHRVMMDTFERWYGAVVARGERNAAALQREQQLVASQAALQAMENKMHARIVAAANRRWMQQAAAKSLASWQAWSRHRLDVRHIGGKAIARFKSRCVAEAFVRWVELCRTIGRVRRMTVRILHRVMMDTFERWYGAVVARGERNAAALQREQQLVASQAALQAMENKMHARIVAAANRRWMQQAAAKSLASWQAWSRHRLDVRHIGGKAIARFKSRCVAEAFVRWVELCRTIGRVRRMTVRILHRVMMDTFERWYDEVVDRRNVKDAAAHAAALRRAKQAHEASITQHISDRELLADIHSKLLADMQQEHAEQYRAYTQARDLEADELQLAAAQQEQELQAAVVEATEAQRRTEDAMRKCQAECTTLQAKVTEYQQAAEQAQTERGRAQEIIIREREQFLKWTLRATTEIKSGDAH